MANKRIEVCQHDLVTATKGHDGFFIQYCRLCGVVVSEQLTENAFLTTMRGVEWKFANGGVVRDDAHGIDWVIPPGGVF